MPDKSKMQDEVLISICIATYKRTALLEKLLFSLTKQILPSEIKLEVIVTDNDNEASARPVLVRFQNTHNVCFKYFVQPLKNISITRNMCVANANGEYICFIDDDETASIGWIINLYDTMKKYKSDGVFGYVEPVFDNKIPPQFHSRRFYFTPVGETGTKAIYYFTTNSMIRSDLIKSEKIPFDPGYGLTGGEDVHLFERLAKKDIKFVVSKEAVSYEYIPVERGTLQYIYNRGFRGGQAFIRRSLEYNNTLSNRLNILVKASIMIIYSLVLYAACFYSKQLRIKYMQLLGSSSGKLRTLFGSLKTLH